jgi:fatty-acid desaturase
MRRGVWRVEGREASAVHGNVVWAPAKSVWNSSMYIGAIVLAPWHFSWSAFAVFLALSYPTLLLGHSLGMHRRLIHRTFDCPKPLERTLVWLGVLVGMAGPFGILRIHDIRDWAQREPGCHDFFAHRRGIWVDALWQLHCTFRFRDPPRFVIESEFARDPWYRFMDVTWPLHQVALGAVLYVLGGLDWVVWGVFVRVAVSVTSHWVVTYFAHNPGPGRWIVRGAGVQASNLPGWGFLTHGECWHNNHHAFPESARLGIDRGQFDPGWVVLRLLQKWRLASNLGIPRCDDLRDDLFEQRDAMRGERACLSRSAESTRTRH